MECRAHNVTRRTKVVLRTHIKFVRIDEEGNPIPISDRAKNRIIKILKEEFLLTTKHMIRFSKYFWAHLISIMGMVMVMVGSPFPILYAFVGGWFIGTGLKWARQSGEEKKFDK